MITRAHKNVIKKYDLFTVQDELIILSPQQCHLLYSAAVFCQCQIANEGYWNVHSLDTFMPWIL
jgi:hypothetical protein